ncbi:unnamed protein product [Echinostoma caproni]|uniref:NPH3 domain-containing protein n=1 Tax=Echinostoma caproni TaxID=27848 RepID=A0A183BCG4_9TREM|nr:unnamed protein product [Echinostoma caproni]
MRFVDPALPVSFLVNCSTHLPKHFDIPFVVRLCIYLRVYAGRLRALCPSDPSNLLMLPGGNKDRHKLKEARPRIEGLVDNLLGSCDGNLKLEVVQLAAEYEHRLQLGQKPIFHLEAFVIAFMVLYKRFVEDALGSGMEW